MERALLYRFVVLSLFLCSIGFLVPGGRALGVNYGMIANNLPSQSAVMSLFKARNIRHIRLFSPNADVLGALKNSGISVILTAFDEELQQLASNPAAAGGWVRANIVPYAGAVNFRYITLGNEEIPGKNGAYILPAMYNIAGALKAAGLSIKVTTAVSMGVVGSSYPPSQGAFTDQAMQLLGPILSYLASTGAPLLLNVYPYFSYIGNPTVIPLDYALFTANRVVVQDGNLAYWNLFDAMVDTVKSALERVGRGGVDVVVTESGWPSAGNGNIATVDNARTYNTNLVKHAHSKAGTPKSPGRELDVYLFAMFNEDMKPEGTERNYGLFYPNMNEVYHVDL